MRLKPITLIFFLVLTSLTFPADVNAAPHADVSNEQVTFDFPNTATFSATLQSTSPIISIELEYGNEQQNCGEVIAKAFPQFTPATSVNTSWTWDMRQSGSLPPGATIWWRWRYTDESGTEFVSETKTTTWLDNTHNWQTITEEDLRLYYYGISQPYAQTLVDASLEGLRVNQEQAGLVPDGIINIFIYPNYEDMRDAILYEPEWAGGLAYPDFNIFIMGVSGFDTEWDKGTVIHELTHVLVGHFLFSCISSVPTWLNEGLAMYNEGTLDPQLQSLLDRAIRSDTLITLRSLNGSFSEIAELANLSYSQSYSVVEFMLETYGQEKMTQLLIALRDAKPIDTALLEVYGFDVDGLDDVWRETVGATPRVAVQSTAMPTPTFVPTYVPVSGVPISTTPTPNAVPTSSFDQSEEDSIFIEQENPPLSFIIASICFCLVFLLVGGVTILGISLRFGNSNKNNQVGGENDSL